MVHSRKKSVALPVKRSPPLNFSDSKVRQEYGVIFNENTKPYMANQVIYDHDMHLLKEKSVKDMIDNTVRDFENATTVTNNTH